MKEFEYDYETMEIKYKGKVIGKWNNEAHIDYPEDLIWDRDIGSLAREMFLASRTATLKEMLEALPSDETIMKESYGYGHEGSKLFELGVNWLTKEIRAIIEKKLESV
ncbi:MAG: hypothetical protein KBA81_06915 [Rhabdochlamydiaceae bacterium]|nr:hypothetical protein [Rhabdochlamydiaceae bacterium]